ncbi:MAG: hypothetical protein VKK80_00310 [Prochlorothrix sp.]|nr:hypothetical protein [Prochlorothrix sp.]
MGFAGTGGTGWAIGSRTPAPVYGKVGARSRDRSRNMLEGNDH